MDYPVITFGHFYKSSDRDREPVEWLVLDKKDDRALVISKYALDIQEYNDVRRPTIWADSSVRNWLNNEFLNACFSSEEKEKLILSDVPADENPICDTAVGRDTQDYLFLLSIREAKKYFPEYGDAKAEITGYCRNRGPFEYASGYCAYWLRTPGEYTDFASYADENGSIVAKGGGVKIDYIAVRPALWIKI